jgi:hypothetical protein
LNDRWGWVDSGSLVSVSFVIDLGMHPGFMLSSYFCIWIPDFMLNLVKSISLVGKSPKIANVDFLETLRKYLCSRII